MSIINLFFYMKKLFLLLMILGGIFLFMQNVLADDSLKININTADVGTLDLLLPGIGAVKAQAIIDYRELNGPFETIEEIMDVSGIGQVTFDGLKDLITVGDNEQSPPEADQPSAGTINKEQETEPPPVQNNIEIIQSEPEVLGYDIGSVMINEFVSDPADGEVEFLELYNTTIYSIDLSGWWIEDGSARKSILGGTILANGFFVLEKPKGNLNNTGDIIKLFDPAGGLIDQVSYGNWDDGNKNDNAPKADDPLATARVYDGQDTGKDVVDFALTQEITKGKPNVIYVEGEIGVSESKTQNNQTTTTAFLISTSTKKVVVESEVKELVKIGDVKIIITEILPNPAGSDTTEMIELYNPTEEDFNLYGLKLDDEDGGSSPYKFPKDTIIKAGEYLVFGKWETKIALNNDMDSARLLAGDNAIIDEIDYSSVTEGAGFARNDSNQWTWTTKITPGAKNSFSAPAPTAVAGVKYSATVETELAELRDRAVGSRVKTKGVVTVLPGVFGTQYFYISNQDGGAQIYMYSKDFPELAIGDEVEVAGEISEAYGETRIKIKNKEDIKVVGKSEPEVIALKISEIDEKYEGSFLRIEGEVTEKKRSYIYLDDGAEEIKVSFKENANIDSSSFETGDRIAVKGILIERSAGYQLLPRSSEDIELLNTAGEGEAVAEASQTDTGEKNLIATAGGLTSILIGLSVKARGFFVVRFIKKLGAVVLAFVKRG